MRFRFELSCPRCNRTATHISDYRDPPRISCGDCLMNDLKFSNFVVESVIALDVPPELTT